MEAVDLGEAGAAVVAMKEAAVEAMTEVAVEVMIGGAVEVTIGVAVEVAIGADAATIEVVGGTAAGVLDLEKIVTEGKEEGVETIMTTGDGVIDARGDSGLLAAELTEFSSSFSMLTNPLADDSDNYGCTGLRLAYCRLLT